MTMIEFHPYSPQDLARIDLQPMQAAQRDLFLSDGYAEAIDVRGKAWSGLLDGEVVGAAGFTPQWDGRSTAWAIFGRKVPKKDWPVIVRFIRAAIAGEMAEHKAKVGHARVDITVPWGFGEGCRLASLLGFEIEGISRKFGLNGADHFVYSRVA